MAAKSALFENYEKGESTVKEKDPKEDFSQLPEKTIVVKVKRGTKVKNIMGFVEKSLKEEENRHIIFSGCGDAIEKAISCVEFTKATIKDLHQITKLSVLRVVEFWDPIKPDLDRLQVTREIPTISILLCKDPLDTNELGYQAPSQPEKTPKVQKPHKRKKPDQNRKNNTDRNPALADKIVKQETD
ncbi:hypothetical protein JTE90_018097 [Oedothorax gibbosus]|uniref:DNA/RNA-binding protein Alba-like domain-containing protein n=1 Tax=Oedothorax gibbosus TaxID=931172 RepID=A0AAV6UG19_9ARAC|nr:hypothetical protein JTE90_018097 [Oedothorax gibbosus]